MSTDDPYATRDLDLKHARRLERIFRPPGLPLIRKDPDAPHATTAILVRGQAGTGKTTLVTALAHAISTQGHGIALFLNTEAFPSELRYKADFLHLPENSLLGWSSRQQAGIGARAACPTCQLRSAPVVIGGGLGMPVCGDKQRNQLLIERFSFRISVNGSGKFGHALLALTAQVRPTG